MKTRREAVKLLLMLGAGVSAFWGYLGSGLKRAYAEARKLENWYKTGGRSGFPILQPMPFSAIRCLYETGCCNVPINFGARRWLSPKKNKKTTR